MELGKVLVVVSRRQAEELARALGPDLAQPVGPRRPARESGSAARTLGSEQELGLVPALAAVRSGQLALAAASQPPGSVQLEPVWELEPGESVGQEQACAPPLAPDLGLELAQELGWELELALACPPFAPQGHPQSW